MNSKKCEKPCILCSEAVTVKVVEECLWGVVKKSGKISVKSVDKCGKVWYIKQAVWNAAVGPASRAKKLQAKRKKCLTNSSGSGKINELSEGTAESRGQGLEELRKKLKKALDKSWKTW